MLYPKHKLCRIVIFWVLTQAAHSSQNTPITINQFKPLQDQVAMWRNQQNISANAILIAYDVDGTLITKPPYLANISVVQQLQKEEVVSIVLSRRNPDMQKGTQNQLKKLPHDAKNLPLDFGISALILKPENNLPTDISYQNGIFLTNKHSKSDMLLKLVLGAQQAIRAVAFVDDDLSNCKSVLKAFEGMNDVELRSFNFRPRSKNK